ncbi:hypothetical protein UlMin_019439 [Ulmus minor]
MKIQRTSSNVENPLFLRLKLPKPELIKEEEEDEALPFVCEVCQKRFQSGKGLGGHKRIHKKEKKGRSKSSRTSKNKTRVCPVCEKEFDSDKSCFGHMRAHSDRNWRGMKEPPNPNKAAHMALSADLKWSHKAKRGHNMTSTSVNNVSNASCSDTAASCLENNSATATVLEAAKDLLMLSAGGANKDNKAEDLILEEDKSDTNIVLGNKKRKMKLVQHLDEDDDHTPSPKKKKVYRCGSCNKSFPSHQALGGHMSSHSKNTVPQLVQDKDRNQVASPKKVRDFDLNELPTCGLLIGCEFI